MLLQLPVTKGEKCDHKNNANGTLGLIMIERPFYFYSIVLIQYRLLVISHGE